MSAFKNFSYQHIFFIIGLIFGLKMVFTNPPWHSNDEDRHFFNAYNMMSGHLGPQVENHKCGFKLPTNLVGQVRSFQGIRFTETNKLSRQKIVALEDYSIDNDTTKFFELPSCKMPPFPYLPSVIMMKIGSTIHASPVWLGWWGRIGSLLAYLLIVFIAIKKTPYFKPLLMVVALSPMALFQGASVSYDSLCLAFLFLFFALLISFYFQEEKITAKQILILFLVAFAQRLSKDGYYLMFFSLAFIPLAKFENKRLYWGGLALMVVASFLPSFLWSSYLNALHLPPELALQKDYAFSASKNLQFHLKDPMHMVQLLGLNILDQGRIWIIGSVGRFGYSYTLLPSLVVIVHILCMIFIVMLEERAQVISMRFRLGILTLLFLNMSAFVVMFFLGTTPIGGYYIFGLQGRYFTPLLPFVIMALFSIPKPLIKANWLQWGVTLYCIIILWYTVNFLNEIYYV